MIKKIIAALFIAHISLSVLPAVIWAQDAVPPDLSGFTWVNASLTDLNQAKLASRQLSSDWTPSFVMTHTVNSVVYYRVCYGVFDTKPTARSFRVNESIRNGRDILREDSWLTKLVSSSVVYWDSGVPAEEPVAKEGINGLEPEQKKNNLRQRESESHEMLAGGAADSVEVLQEVSELESQDPELNPNNKKRSFARYFGLRLLLMSGYDSNIDHNQIYLQSPGLVPGLRLDFRSSVESPWLELSYSIGQHQWFDAERWNRTSHLFRTQLQPRLRGRFRVKTTGELSLKGTTEDRDLSDQIQIGQEVEFRFTRYQRLNITGIYRKKSFEDSTRNAIKPYIELSLEQRFKNDRHWETAVRYEFNDAPETRRDYKRWTFILGYELPLGNSFELDLEAKHRRKLYDDRDVEIEGDDYLRRDFKWHFNASLVKKFSRKLEAELSYAYELNDSLDPDKEWKAHLGRFALSYQL